MTEQPCVRLFTTDGELIEKWEIKTDREDQGSRMLMTLQSR